MAQENMLGITQSLFGVTPTYEQEFGSALKNLSGMTASDIGRAAGFASAKQLGRGLLGAAGIEDPEMASANRAKQIAAELQQQGVSMQSAQGMKMLAQRLSEAGDFRAAQAAAALAANFEDQEVSTGLKQAQTFQATQRGIQATREKDPEVVRLQRARDELEQQFGPNDRRVQELNRILEGRAKAGQTNIDLGGVFAKESEKAEAKDIVEAIRKAQEVVQTGSKLSRDIDVIEQLLPNSFTGQFANWSKTASKTLSGLGVNVGEKASNTEALNALFTNFVLPAVKQLPGSLAAKELDFLRQSKPETLQEPATIRRLVGMLKEDLAANKALVRRADQYKRENNSMRNFNIALEQDDIYNNIRKYNQLKTRVTRGEKISKEEAEFAKSVEKELGL